MLPQCAQHGSPTGLTVLVVQGLGLGREPSLQESFGKDPSHPECGLSLSFYTDSNLTSRFELVLRKLIAKSSVLQ